MKMKKWMKAGLNWGLFMFVIMTFIWPLIDGEEITIKNVLIGFFLWGILGSFFFGRSMKNRLDKEG